MTLQWTKELETGVSSIDNDHKELIEINNMLVDALIKPDHASMIRPLIGTLCSVWLHHVRMEEDIMIDLDYPAYEAHKLHHEEFTYRLLTMEHDDPDLLDTYDNVSQFMIEFIAVHLDKHDIPLANYLRGEALTKVVIREDGSDLCKAIVSVWASMIGKESAAADDAGDSTSAPTGAA